MFFVYSINLCTFLLPSFFFFHYFIDIQRTIKEKNIFNELSIQKNPEYVNQSNNNNNNQPIDLTMNHHRHHRHESQLSYEHTTSLFYSKMEHNANEQYINRVYPGKK